MIYYTKNKEITGFQKYTEAAGERDKIHYLP